MKNIPFLDLKAQYLPLADEIQRELKEVCETTQFILGGKVKAFEDAFAKAVGAKHCIALNTGTSALHLAMDCLGIGAGDEVIVPAMTFIATVWGAVYARATPVLVDVDPATRNLDPKKLEAAITPRTKAIIPVHLYGQPADLDAIFALATKHNIPVIEDTAQAHLAQYKGKIVGSLGVMGCFSFYPGKNLGAYGEGGALTTNDDALAKAALSLRDHGQAQRYHHDRIGYNYRMDGFQGAVLGVKLRHLSNWTEQRRRAAARYSQKLTPLADRGLIEIPREPEWSRGVYHLYVVLVKNRDAVKDKLTAAGVNVGLHYPIPLHLQKALAHLKHQRGDFPVAERIADECISLPMFPELSDADVDYVANALTACLAS